MRASAGREGDVLGRKVTSWSVRTSAGREGRRRLRGQKVDEGGVEVVGAGVHGDIRGRSRPWP